MSIARREKERERESVIHGEIKSRGAREGVYGGERGKDELEEGSEMARQSFDRNVQRGGKKQDQGEREEVKGKEMALTSWPFKEFPKFENGPSHFLKFKF